MVYCVCANSWYQYVNRIRFLKTRIFPPSTVSIQFKHKMHFIGKVILITGASSGIGAACAKYFAKKGALLSLVGRNADKFEKVNDEIQKCGVEMEPLIILADVTVDAERIMNETIDKYGHLDILINNAGVLIPGTFESMTMDDYDTMMATNVRGVVSLTQLAIPHLIETKGNIVNVSSISGIIPTEQYFAYACSKAGLDHFTRCLAIELAEKGVRVNSINPGFIDTESHLTGRNEDEYAALREEMRLKHPISRIGTKEDCVNAIVSLCDENASFITGVLLRVDGGISTKGAY